MEPGERTLDQLLKALDVARSCGVETGRDQTPKVGADVKILMAEMDELARNPRYFAHSGHVQMLITRDEMETLRRSGSPSEDVQVLRSFKLGESSVTFSDPCSSGRRWIHLGESEHEDQCACGKTYRVVFDRTPQDLHMKREMCCMDCGEAYGLTLDGSGKNALATCKCLSGAMRRLFEEEQIIIDKPQPVVSKLADTY